MAGNLYNLDASDSIKAFSHAAMAVPDDDAFIIPTKEIYIGGTGDLHVIMADSQEVTFTALPVGTVLRLSIIRIFEDSTVTNVVLMW